MRATRAFSHISNLKKYIANLIPPKKPGGTSDCYFKKKQSVREIGRQIKFPPQRSGKTGAASRGRLFQSLFQRYPIPETNRHTVVDGRNLAPGMFNKIPVNKWEYLPYQL